MIRRLLHHFFWGFYDYLGSHLVIGSVIAFPILLAISHAYPWLVSLGTVPGVVAAVVVGIGLLAFLAAGLAGAFHFSTLAVQDHPARLADFRAGVRLHFLRYAGFLVLALLVAVIGFADAAFYLRTASSKQASPAQLAVSLAGVLFVWILLGAVVYMLALAPALARLSDAGGMLARVRKAFVLFAIAPVFWFCSALILLVFELLAIVSVLGILFVVPLFTCFTSTALELAIRQIEFLRQARAELGENRSVAQYRAKAAELAWEWEAAQPKRTFRELIKPWEM